MSNITIKKVRVGTDLLMHVSLKDNGVKVSWKSVEDIFAYLFSDAQNIMAGRAEASIDPTDEYNLIVTYGVNEPQYLGVNRLVISCVYEGKTATYDCPVVEFVEKSAEEGETTAEATQVDLEVSAVNTSLLDKAIDAALAASAKALEAASKAPYIGENGNWFVWNAKTGLYEDTGTRAEGLDGRDGKSPYIGSNGHWFVYDDTRGEYVDSGVTAQGPEGPKGKDGGILWPTFEIDAAMHLQMETHEDTGAERFALDDAGHLVVEL